jgi:MarR family transcriptional regulator, lower aerobic nicotinate degradation pathway regulator
MPDQPDNKAAALRQSVSALLRLFLVNERRFPLAGTNERYSPLDFQTLNFLALHPGAKVGALTDFLTVAPTTTTTLIDRLAKRGLVARAAHSNDKRAKALTLTPAGRAMFDAIYAQDLVNMQAMLNALPPDEQAQLVSMMGKIVAALQAD